MTTTEIALVFCTLVFIITTLYFMYRKDLYKKRARIATEEAIYQTNVRKTSDKEFDRMSDFVKQIQKEMKEANKHLEMLKQTKRLLQKGAQGQHTLKAMRDIEEYLKNY